MNAVLNQQSEKEEERKERSFWFAGGNGRKEPRISMECGEEIL